MTDTVASPGQATAVNDAGASHSPFRPIVIIALMWFMTISWAVGLSGRSARGVQLPTSRYTSGAGPV